MTLFVWKIIIVTDFHIVKSKKLREFFVPLFGKEKLSNLMATETEVYKLAVDQITKKDKKFTEIAKEIVTATKNKSCTSNSLKTYIIFSMLLT